MAKNTDEANFKSDVLDATRPVVVDFWAEWCGPCKMIGASLDEISAENTDFDIVKVNLDENPEIAGQYGVRSIPTLIMFKGGEPVSVQVGAAPKSKLLDWIRKSAA